MRSEWNTPKGKLGQCKNIIIFLRLSFGDECFHLLFGSTFLHNHYIYPLSIACSALGHCQGLSLISRFRYSHTLWICNCFFSGCLHFGEWHSTLGRASAVSGNTTASQIIVSRPHAQCTVRIAQCTMHSAQPFISTSYVQCASITFQQHKK